MHAAIACVLPAHTQGREQLAQAPVWGLARLAMCLTACSPRRLYPSEAMQGQRAREGVSDGADGVLWGLKRRPFGTSVVSRLAPGAGTALPGRLGWRIDVASRGGSPLCPVRKFAATADPCRPSQPKRMFAGRLERPLCFASVRRREWQSSTPSGDARGFLR